MEQYKLEGKEPVTVADALEWAKWFQTADRKVARDEVVAGPTSAGPIARFRCSGRWARPEVWRARSTRSSF